jgi:hypothetical protein
LEIHGSSLLPQKNHSCTIGSFHLEDRTDGARRVHVMSGVVRGAPGLTSANRDVSRRRSLHSIHVKGVTPPVGSVYSAFSRKDCAGIRRPANRIEVQADRRAWSGVLCGWACRLVLMKNAPPDSLSLET